MSNQIIHFPYLSVCCHYIHAMIIFPTRWCMTHIWYSSHAAFPLGSKKCGVRRPTVLLRPQTLCGNIQLQPTKDWAFPPALLTTEHQGPQKHAAHQGQVTKLLFVFCFPVCDSNISVFYCFIYIADLLHSLALSLLEHWRTIVYLQGLKVVMSFYISSSRFFVVQPLSVTF